MKLFTSPNGKKNLKKLRDTLCSVLISECKHQNISYSVISKPILELFDEYFSNSSGYSFASKFGANFDYIQQSYKVLYSFCRSLLLSGKYHLWHGELNPTGEAIFSIFTKVIDFYISSGLLPSEKRAEQLEILLDDLSVIG